MLEENVYSNQIFDSLTSYSQSYEPDICLNQKNSFYDTKISSNDFQLEYNKAFNDYNQTTHDDNTHDIEPSSNYLFGKVNQLLTSIQAPITNETYIQLSEYLCELSHITDNQSSVCDTDYTKALMYKSAVVNKMMEYLELIMPFDLQL